MDELEKAPRLIAIHFVRHCFILPFVSGFGLSVDESHFHRRAASLMRDAARLTRMRAAWEIRFDCSSAWSDYRALELFKGLRVFLSQPPTGWEDRRPSGRIRPVLRGLGVDTQVLDVEFDLDRIKFAIGVDYLKDVEVTLFTDVPRS